MPLRSRAGTLLLLIGGLALVGWMGYALTYRGDTSGSDRRVGGVADVAVFLPERADWAEFRAGVFVCQRRGLLGEVVEDLNTITFRTPEHGREVRLSWFEGGGVVTTRDRVNRLIDRPIAPMAFIGSSNTVLTAGLAEALHDAVDHRRGAGQRPDPVLLVPWATTVRVDRPGAASLPLLDLYPGRTFRFCPNNRQEAELVSRVVSDQEGEPVGAVLMVDGNDPYSRDLAEGFERAIDLVAPEAKVLIRRLDLSSPGLVGSDDRPGPAELEEADLIWRFVAEAPGEGPVWAVLPLQGSPTRRMIRALVDRSGPIGPGVLGRLHVLCGDGIGRTTLDTLAGRCTLPVWCVSSGTLPEDEGQPADLGASQIPAEIIAALARVLDQPGPPPDLASALVELDVSAEDPAAFGRSLAFEPSGERRAADLGHVLAIVPGRSEVLAFGPPRVQDLGGEPRSRRSLAGARPADDARTIR
ncbi:ABC transporter substrate-binding protein [Tautonia marina]|uniref:ABC transporter substrate-binding protein n=1 Tax=Tautonia marina TaxID=2653855 RepID=UPI001260B8CB|nr:hypothetical protein [Tautonia marina]